MNLVYSFYPTFKNIAGKIQTSYSMSRRYTFASMNEKKRTRVVPALPPTKSNYCLLYKLFSGVVVQFHEIFI